MWDILVSILLLLVLGTTLINFLKGSDMPSEPAVLEPHRVLNTHDVSDHNTILPVQTMTQYFFQAL